MPEEAEEVKKNPKTVELGENDSAAIFRGNKIEFIVSDSEEEDAVMGQTGMSIVAAVLTDKDLNAVVMSKLMEDVKKRAAAELQPEEVKDNG